MCSMYFPIGSRFHGISPDFHGITVQALQVPTITTWQASFGPSGGVVHTFGAEPPGVEGFPPTLLDSNPPKTKNLGKNHGWLVVDDG